MALQEYENQIKNLIDKAKSELADADYAELLDTTEEYLREKQDEIEL